MLIVSIFVKRELDRYRDVEIDMFKHRKKIERIYTELSIMALERVGLDCRGLGSRTWHQERRGSRHHLEDGSHC